MILVKRLVAPWLGLAFRKSLTSTPAQSFALMSLFEQPKKPSELSSMFKKPTRLAGHLKQKSRKGYVSPKLNTRVKDSPQRVSNHRSMLKRIKIVGPRWNRQFKRLHSQNYHLKRKKSQANLKRKSRAAYIAKADMWRLKKLIPYYKRKSLKNLY